MMYYNRFKTSSSAAAAMARRGREEDTAAATTTTTRSSPFRRMMLMIQPHSPNKRQFVNKVPGRVGGDDANQMMLLSDMILKWDPSFRRYLELYGVDDVEPDLCRVHLKSNSNNRRVTNFYLCLFLSALP